MGTTLKWFFLIFILVLLFLINLSFGSVDIPLIAIFRMLLLQEAENPIWTSILMDFRMTKAFTCVLAGSDLSLGGLQMQTLFRNPLAGPDVLGLTSGASLAVSLILMSNAVSFTFFSTGTPWAIAIAASLGCVSVFIIMLAFSSKLQDNVSLLIIGLMVGAGTSAIVSVLQYLSRAEEMQTYMLWTFGSLGGLNWNELLVLTSILFIGIIIASASIKSLNTWLLGDLYARSLGIDINRSRFFIILSASVLTGGVTAFCGPIAFVGLAVPHLVKLVINTSNHKVLIPAVLLGGAILLLLCDILTQLPGNNSVLPINAITAMIGAPVVIWVILKNKRIDV
ncbi:iron ABC transporter permease [Chryseosolibacter indicus]|uniref:Iron ABC transporter permease n=1 Tax=Chryseosolibacter indicus TaxID=2782351 RepID=A0ABS5VL26_9BACT|nr:iron ABC transporter permease [Chryseosolibacter indicus]MBT1702081.1 iron ABC transporter permease [Chryseosolibacter indicus]